MDSRSFFSIQACFTPIFLLFTFLKLLVPYLLSDEFSLHLIITTCISSLYFSIRYENYPVV
ncbi:hypothetical protein JCM6292_1802 [Bacteroides pyogenes JCM 6292]|uniref:Uncharacterized protein n=2 Tax=Bacteroides pyogenes TaxID=310300 RepID=W4PM69_9BACE|nr:hypothetical protein JCM6292_1802 [Bacteroides pyogenes JCM 6292]GAE20518.1 hypothetical protein JCM6294_3732 [Bacteroides pyogenes DSM 20611 = JCM 6294]